MVNLVLAVTHNGLDSLNRLAFPNTVPCESQFTWFTQTFLVVGFSDVKYLKDPR